jgi:hypothetical protein
MIGFALAAGVAMGGQSAWAATPITIIGPHPGCDDHGNCKPGAPRPHFSEDDQDQLGPTLKFFQDCIATGSHSSTGGWCPGGPIPPGGI